MTDEKLQCRRLKSVSVLGSSWIDYDYMDATPSGDYIVDDSNFVPMSETVKALTGNGGTFTTSEAANYFDFADGRDTGIRIPVDRMHDIKDLAEISVVQKAAEKALDKSIKEGKRKGRLERQIEETLAGSKDVTPAAQAAGKEG